MLVYVLISYDHSNLLYCFLSIVCLGVLSATTIRISVTMEKVADCQQLGASIWLLSGVKITLVLLKFGVETLAVTYWTQPPGVDFCCVFIVDGVVYRGLSGVVG